MSLELNKSSGNWHDVTNARTLTFYATEDLVHGDLISSADSSFIPPKGYTYDFCAIKQANTNLASFQVFEPTRIQIPAGTLFTAVAFLGFATNEDPANPPETTTTITNTVVGHKIADYTNELGTVVSINETSTTFSQNIVDGKITFTNESGTAVDAKILSTDAGNTILIGSDGGVFYNGAGIVSGASWDDTTNTLTLSFVDGSTVDIPIVDNIVSFINPTLYTQDGSLASDRTVNGNSHQLTFDSNNGFYISNNSGDLSLNGSVASIYTSTGNIDITPFGNLILGNIQNNNSADRVLAQDSATGATQFIDTSVLGANIYNADGTLTGNRILDGDSWNQGINFGELAYFNVYATNFYSESQAGNTIENGATGISLQAMTTGQTLTLQGAIVNLGGVTDTYVSYLNQDDTQNKVLVLDGSDKLFWRDASSFANNIYTVDGTLLSNRVLNGDSYAFDLSLVQISNFGVEANELSLYANNNATIESNGNLNLLANENLTGGVAKNTDLRSIPDWDLTGDLSGRIYSGNDVLDLFGTLGANIRGTGFFNKRTSNNVIHYLFVGDSTGTGGTADEVSIGINDLGLTPLSVEFGLVRDTGAGQPSHRLRLDSATAYYHMEVATESNLNETFANTGFTAQRFSDINESRYEYLSGNHHYALKFNEVGGQYLELHNQDTFGPENSYTRMFRTSIQSSVSDGILSNGTTLNLTGFNIYTLPQYANVPSEKIVVRDDATGDLKDSIGIDRISRKKTHVIINAGAGYTANLDEFVIFQGAGTGAYTGEILTLPNPVSDGDTLTIKVKTNDVLRLDGAGYLIDGNSTFDIDGTVISGQQPSITLEYDLTLNEWQVI